MDTQFSLFQEDALKEVVNIGAGNASTALSQLVNKDVDVFVPKIFFDTISKVADYLGESEKVQTVILLKMLGDITGSVLLIFPPESAVKLTGLLTNNPKEKLQELDEIDKSALCEVGNILTGTCFSALSKFLDMSILQSVPGTASDMLGSVIN
ncbi:chemotaxis protein CheC, partial [Patescibacteria group bacterium]|nr:chemotaxis protein CheC [Patescibacteria group bacterium]